MMPINAAERATVIAALRLWQRELLINNDHPPADLYMTATERGRWAHLSSLSVDELIARILVFNSLTA